MQPGGTRQAILVATALAAGAVLAAWWWSARRVDAEPRQRAAVRASNLNTVSDRAQASPVRERVADEPAQVATKPAIAPAPSPGSVSEGSRNVAPISSNDSVRDSADAGTPPDPSQKQAVGNEAAAAATATASSDEGRAITTKPADETANDAAATDAATPGRAVDADEAADLFAGFLEKAAAGEMPAGVRLEKDFQSFDSRENGGDKERELERALRTRTEEWISSLPSELAVHVLLTSVECRVGMCRVLLAQTGVDFTAPPPNEAPESPINQMQTASWSFFGGDWLSASGLHMVTNSMYAAGKNGLDTALWIVVLQSEGS